MYNPIFKNKFQQACLERLKWLSKQKEDVVKTILTYLQNKRTLTFCSTIEQTEILGEHCINSKNKKALETLNKFQNKEINHITACGMLNEGANLVDCQVGVFASLHSSEIIITQRNGRLLRHLNPIFIIPYYKNTRDEEIVEVMLKDYNPEKVQIISSIQELTNI
jgi:superfamily II DNA or RNA helicase